MSERRINRQLGELYSAMDPELRRLQFKAKERTYQYNQTLPGQSLQRQLLLAELLGDCDEQTQIKPNFECDYGFNVHFKGSAVVESGCVMLDSAEIMIGNNVYFAEHVCLACASHPLVVEERQNALAYAQNITIEEDVWVGEHCTILGGVTIGRGAIIQAGSVVSDDIPSGMVAKGNPCKAIRVVTQSDRDTFRLPESDILADSPAVDIHQ